MINSLTFIVAVTLASYAFSASFSFMSKNGNSCREYDWSSEIHWERYDWPDALEGGRLNSFASTDNHKILIYKINGLAEELHIQFIRRLKWKPLRIDDMFKTGTVEISYKYEDKKCILSNFMFLELLDFLRHQNEYVWKKNNPLR